MGPDTNDDHGGAKGDADGDDAGRESVYGRRTGDLCTDGQSALRRTVRPAIFRGSQGPGRTGDSAGRDAGVSA